MNLLLQVYQEWGLKINFLKTEYMVVGEEDGEDLIVDGGSCARVDLFKYLGSYLDRRGSSVDDVRRRVEQSRKATRMLHPVLWNDTISEVNKKRIFTTIVEAILTYASETWTMDPRLYSKVQAVEMDFWRRCLRVTRLDRLRNDVIRERMGVSESVNERIAQRRLRWYGHCRRMSLDRWPRRILDWQPGGRRGRGRPRTTWMEGVHEEMAGRGLQEGDWADRDFWSSTLTGRGNP